MRDHLSAIFLVALGVFSALPAAAQEHVAFGAGWSDVLDKHSTAQLSAEYRWRDVYYGLRPTVGFSMDADSARYLYGGVNWDIPVAPRLFLTPNFMVGAYGAGAGKDLGGALEFRSGLEVAYDMLGDGSRVGLAFNHISNASIYDRNPGAESLMLIYEHKLR